ncbi:MAG TPA: thymidine phosphorylase [Bacteroidetes bacterium]|nr:thymidine phosphorylase [Bacteroidota bacterium]HRR09103.1 thymidine phosphorylase [Rhodothermales bacterium]
MNLNIIDILTAKRDGDALSDEAIRWLVAAYTSGDVTDYQMSAFLMAAFIRGMSEAETQTLTRAMLYSGEVLDLSDLPGIKVDKHSTGGVGDKISLPLAPIVAACGVPVPMISGRGLGHSGGTLDKLESIPGFNVNLSISEYRWQLQQNGLVLIGQTPEIAPADRKLYALRDVTATVPFIPFIASSIMSKKLAEGIDALVLDVKCGRGAFMQTEPEAKKLAQTLVEIGEAFGKPTVGWITNMNVPLGRAVGNWLEVEESVRCLKGENVPEVMELTYVLAGEMLCLGGVAETPEAGCEMAQEVVANGKAFDKFLKIVQAQGGDPRALEDTNAYPNLAPAYDIYASDTAMGYVQEVDALTIGKTAVLTGAGRMKKEDPVDPGAGIYLHCKPGSEVHPGMRLATLYTHKTDDVPTLQHAVISAYRFGEERPAPAPLLIQRVTGKQSG